MSDNLRSDVVLKPNLLADQAAERLLARIGAGEWPVGAKLPGETTLATELGVGRSTVREALRALASAGVVRSRQGAGVFVTAREPAEPWVDRLRRAAVAEVYEVREMVEVRAAALAATRRTDTDLAALDAALAARTRAAAEDDAAFVDADIALHAAVVAAAHNPVLTDLFAGFVPVLRQGLVDLVALLDLRRSETNPGDEAHSALVHAVRARDPERASRVVAGEISRTLDRLSKASLSVR
ncbi:FCD domain-containing protein [Actinosynnema sp. NPDC020468]|uniref:FadR/GntR family transcriptional regulator n=1 Tax=Actinosynnema sp. NPDC020468 TaxID=3154488 RepID=UPI00340D60F6